MSGIVDAALLLPIRLGDHFRRRFDMVPGACVGDRRGVSENGQSEPEDGTLTAYLRHPLFVAQTDPLLDHCRAARPFCDGPMRTMTTAWASKTKPFIEALPILLTGKRLNETATN